MVTRPAQGDATEVAWTTAGPLLFDESPCFIAIIDRELRLTRVNRTMQETFDVAPGTPCHCAYKGLDKPCSGCRIQQIFDDREPLVFEEQGLSRAGRLVRYRAKVIPLPGPDGQVEQLLHIAMDTTRLQELEEGFAQAERLATVGLTTAGLAHTIKNLLAGLEGGIYVVNSAMKKERPEQLIAGWEMVCGYIEQVQGLVKNLLDYSRPRPPVYAPLAPAELVSEVVELFAARGSQTGVAIAAEVAPDLPTVVMDREAIHASLCNLVTNAIDACNWDPTQEKPHRITVAARPTGDGGVRFEVRDNGMGISAENQPRILATSFTTKGMRGNGLGLLMTKQAVLAHGGAIAFSSTAGEGTTFTIQLPARGPARETPSQDVCPEVA